MFETFAADLALENEKRGRGRVGAIVCLAVVEILRLVGGLRLFGEVLYLLIMVLLVVVDEWG